MRSSPMSISANSTPNGSSFTQATARCRGATRSLIAVVLTRRHAHRAERVATVDEQEPAGDERVAQPRESERSNPRMTAVERPHPDGEGNVVARLSRLQLELLGRHLTSGQPLG